MKFTGERFIPGQGGTIELEHLNRYYFVINQIDLTSKTVLDIASGEGYGSNILAQYAEMVYGVDISQEAIEYASKKYYRKNLRFSQGSITNIPINQRSIDVVVSFETIEHDDRHQQMLSEIKRVLKTNGLLVLSSPDKDYFLNFEKNKFHVKELFYQELKDLIRHYFKNNFYFFQSVFAGSIIALDGKSTNYKKPIIVKKNGVSTEFSPVYLVAICTDDKNYTPENQLIFYKNSDGILTQEDIEIAKQSIRKKRAFRLGKFILRPFSYLHNKLFL